MSTTQEERDGFRAHVDEWGDIPADDIVRLIDQVEELQRERTIDKAGLATTKEERAAMRKDIEYNKTQGGGAVPVSERSVLRLLDDADAAGALEKDRDAADKLHLEACEKWSALEKEVRKLRSGITTVLGLGIGSFNPKVGVIRCQKSGNPCGTDTWVVGRPCKCEHCTAYLALHALVLPDKQ